MNILFIYPPITTFERYSSAIGNAGGRQVPLGVYSLAAYARRDGHAVTVIDAEALELSAAGVVARLREINPDLVGLSASTVAFHRAVETAKAIKAAAPDVPLVLGGPHASADPLGVMREDCFDYAVVGEGELPLASLIQTLTAGGDMASVPGLVHRAQGKTVVNPRPQPIRDLSSLPYPAFDLISDLSLYNPPPCNYKRIPVVNVITGRGCPSLCTFCDRSVFGTKLRQRPAGHIAGEIEWLYNRFGVREIAFVDDTFTIGQQRIRDLFAILAAKGISLPWTCMSRIDTVDFELLTFMRDNGCWHISFGIESGSPEILAKVQKNISLDMAATVIGWCRKLGIRTKGFFIMGHPGETLQTLDQTIAASLTLPLDDVLTTLNTPLPGSEQYAQAQSLGEMAPPDWSRFNMWNPVFIPAGLSRDILLAKQREMFRRFYLRPRIMWRYFLSFFSLSGLRRAMALTRSLPFLFRRKSARPD